MIKSCVIIFADTVLLLFVIHFTIVKTYNLNISGIELGKRLFHH